jgi:hypothetical protein
MTQPQFPLDSSKAGCALGYAVSHQLPTAAAWVNPDQIMWIYGEQVALEQFSLSALVSPASSHSTDSSTLMIYHPELVQQVK